MKKNPRMIPWLEGDAPFPAAERALKEPNGLLAAGGDLSPERLLAGYRRGIFPWYSEEEPILWWSPDPRMVLLPEEFRASRSLRKTQRNTAYEIRFDGEFDAVVAACAAPRSGQPGTWITGAMRAAYNRLHRLGHAHSVETWIDGSLAGGLYGVALGGVFFGESMFSRHRDASKLALAALVEKLLSEGPAMIDCQVHTDHLESLGAHNVPRREFMRCLGELIHLPRTAGSWSSGNYRNDPCRS
jgi:leucyl/phenylalanyl-tRNA--protein transferase